MLSRCVCNRAAAAATAADDSARAPQIATSAAAAAAANSASVALHGAKARARLAHSCSLVRARAKTTHTPHTRKHAARTEELAQQTSLLSLRAPMH